MSLQSIGFPETFAVPIADHIWYTSRKPPGTMLHSTVMVPTEVSALIRIGSSFQSLRKIFSMDWNRLFQIANSIISKKKEEYPEFYKKNCIIFSYSLYFLQKL